MRTTDNNGGKKIVDFNEVNIADLQLVANKSLLDLQKKNKNLLVFPQSFIHYKDNIEKSQIFSLNEEKLTTNNLMGFIGCNNSKLTITSRFAKNDKDDYFLHYMLQRVFSINLLDFNQRRGEESIWDFLIYLFPYFLKKAHSQGIYKAYKKENYNDSNVKGVIDVKRHIHKNIPFMGKVAYKTRELSYDNYLTQLIRHTIEYIKVHRYGAGILTNESDIRDIVNEFTFITNKSYNRNSRQKLISLNLKIFSHPYFTEYTFLQKICLQILRQEKTTFGEERDKIYGLLFDGAWLWEEYLNKVIKDCDFKHPENKTSSGAIHLFENPKSYKRYPDFWKENFVLDAKYKNLSDYIDRDDIHQLISYMYVLKAEQGGFIYPTKKTKGIDCKNIGDLFGYGGNVKTWAISIPQESANFIDFKKEMEMNEKELTSHLK